MIIARTIWSFLSSPVGIAILAVLAFAVYSYAIFQEGKKYGEADYIIRQQATDRKVIDGARESRDNVDRCRASGGVWDRSTGECK